MAPDSLEVLCVEFVVCLERGEPVLNTELPDHVRNRLWPAPNAVPLLKAILEFLNRHSLARSQDGLARLVEVVD